MNAVRKSWIVLIVFVAVSGLLTACDVLIADSPTPTPASVYTPTAEPTSASISGRVWQDLCVPPLGGQPLGLGCLPVGDERYRADGMIELGEPGFGGVSVGLGVGACPAPAALQTTTAADGVYSFKGLPPGTYCLAVDPQSPSNAALLAGSWTHPDVSIGPAVISATMPLRALHSASTMPMMTPMLRVSLRCETSSCSSSCKMSMVPAGNMPANACICAWITSGEATRP